MKYTSRIIAGAATSALALGLTAPAALAHGGHRHSAAPVVNSRPVVVDEGAGTATVTITLRRAAPRDISLDWSTLSRGFKTYRGDFRHQSRDLARSGHHGHHRIGRATPGEDYTASTGTVVIAAGSKTASVTVPVIDDTKVEPGEIFLVRFRATRPATKDGSARTAHTARGSFASHLRGHHRHFRHSLTVPVLITDNDTATPAS
ncbi:Calx-beta domain-containing protein [Nocardioides sp. CER19]|uniref:Calx-beta domain-containing protein n=1 Tax=Nocardioides sp. CER19 TaxID=3038538 RepID=UPI002449BD36|nr:Calx-beta domain-containing protein [Nocardioides sp. CER19]MDH2416553.1 Calx-beta domain-containing protein [Nocardioides sp. CER19]